MDEKQKAFSADFYNRLKNTVNASVKCVIDKDNDDKMNIYISRLGLVYKTSISGVNKLLESDISETEKEFDKVVGRYRTYVEHKFFYF